MNTLESILEDPSGLVVGAIVRDAGAPLPREIELPEAQQVPREAFAAVAPALAQAYGIQIDPAQQKAIAALLPAAQIKLEEFLAEKVPAGNPAAEEPAADPAPQEPTPA